MDRAGVIGMEGSYTSTGGQDKSTLVLTVRGADQRNRTVIVKGCAEPHVCAFFAAAVKADLVDKAPAACTDGIRCIEVEERTPQDPHQFVPKKP